MYQKNDGAPHLKRCGLLRRLVSDKIYDFEGHEDLLDFHWLGSTVITTLFRVWFSQITEILRIKFWGTNQTTIHPPAFQRSSKFSWIYKFCCN
ncbi:hypothetical protein CMI42_01425 [Candidatus Pacearchaeota archaeon]|nr:hypothetical protein [Candidatus Pacearchaeota archaeon]